MNMLDGRVAVVTGAGHGLGRSHAKALAAAGARVLANDVDATAANACAAEIGGVADHTALHSIADGEAVIAHALDAFGELDIVVNNAGISRRAAIEELDDELLDQHLGVHLKATLGTMKAAFATMRRGGSIINTVSGAGLHPEWGGVAAYGAAKAAIYSVTKIGAIEGGSRGIRVNAISPLARTRMSEAFLNGREGDFDPAQPSAVVVFLASDRASNLTGRIIRCGGNDLGMVELQRVSYREPGAWTPDAVAEVFDALP
jgi:NAD(P)-dependent dehydrogenase (short-subunit alcohol dehydrogenase family)